MKKPVINAKHESMTEWFAAIGEVAESQAFREEDNRKQERLIELMNQIDLPYRPPYVFRARELKDKTPIVQSYLAEHGTEPCAFRLVGDTSSLPKLRSRGYTVQDCYDKWFSSLSIDFDSYTVSIFPNESDLTWSTIFVVGTDAVFGEIIRGIHSQLTQGETTNEVIQFRYDYSTWQWSTASPDAELEMQRVMDALHVPDPKKQKALNESLQASFSHDYLTGYFESFALPAGTFYFLDYNRILPRHLPSPPPLVSSNPIRGKVTGMCAFPGTVSGKVIVVDPDTISTTEFPTGSILVCDVTDIRYLPLMKESGAIVTDRGGILSHAAIIARELNIPCIVATGNATEVLKTGARVTVDAEAGTVLLA